MILEAEMQNKHSEKQKLTKNKQKNNNKQTNKQTKIQRTLKRGLNLIIINTVFHQLNVALKSKFRVINSRTQL